MTNLKSADIFKVRGKRLTSKDKKKLHKLLTIYYRVFIKEDCKYQDFSNGDNENDEAIILAMDEEQEDKFLSVNENYKDILKDFKKEKETIN